MVSEQDHCDLPFDLIFPKFPTASSSEIRACNQQVSRRSTESSKTMADFKHLSYYDQLREIERHLVKLQDSYRRIPSVPQSQPMDLISDLPANLPNFQSIEPIEGVLESPHTKSICDSMKDLHSPSEEHRDRVDPAPSTQEPGSNLGANSEEQNCEMVYSSTKELIADLVGGNKSLYKLQLLEIDGQEIDQYPTKLKIKTGMDDLGKTLGAYYVFDKMSTREIALPQFSTTLKKSDFTSANGIQCCFLYVAIGKNLVFPHGCSRVIFEPGGVFALFVTKISRMTSFWSGVEVTMEADFFYLRWQWDPGGAIVLVAEIL